jgi:predicted aminopeptidase
MSCGHIRYYAQAINGHWQVMKHTQPITQILQESDDIALKQQLTTVLKIKDFATQVLKLPENASYTKYADLKRPYVVWSVFAAPPFSLELKQWCFLFAGCISYRGYFNESAAQAFAKELRQQGYDVYVGGVAAYSTLGWLSDPVLNTMLAWPNPHLAGLIFHELAHQHLYIQDDSRFNESFASAIEQIGIERWLAHYGTAQEIADYSTQEQRQREFVTFILTTRVELENIYQQALSDEQKRLAKQHFFEQLQTRYMQLKTQWQGYTGYDKWFTMDLNNAKLASVMTYQDHVPAFLALLIRCQNDLTAFYTAVRQLGQLPFTEREQHLKLLTDEKTTPHRQQHCGF